MKTPNQLLREEGYDPPVYTPRQRARAIVLALLVLLTGLGVSLVLLVGLYLTVAAAGR